jgi:hypothetical protein
VANGGTEGLAAEERWEEEPWTLTEACAVNAQLAGQRNQATPSARTEADQVPPPGGVGLSKWFYDTSTGASTGAYRCDSFVGGAQIAQGVGYQGIRWTRGFTWFRPPEHNTLRPWVNGVVLLCLSARLRSSLFSLSVRVCGVRPLQLSSARTFYSPRPGSYKEAP